MEITSDTAERTCLVCKSCGCVAELNGYPSLRNEHIDKLRAYHAKQCETIVQLGYAAWMKTQEGK